MVSTSQMHHLILHKFAGPFWCMSTLCIQSQLSHSESPLKCCTCRGARQQLQQDGTLLVQKSLKKCVESIMMLSVHLDMLGLQISNNSRHASHYVMRRAIVAFVHYCNL